MCEAQTVSGKIGKEDKETSATVILQQARDSLRVLFVTKGTEGLHESKMRRQLREMKCNTNDKGKLKGCRGSSPVDTRQ